MSNRFADRVAVVTGFGSGIGRAIALRFAAEGAVVAGIDLDPKGADETVRLITLSSGRAESLIGDVSDFGAVHQLVEGVAERHGRLDILVNNAGVGHVGDIENTSEADFERLFQVNVKGVFNGMAAAIRPMLTQGEGVILNLASIASKLGLKRRFAYGMTKGAVLAMTLSVARDYVDKGIRCNCICPARIHTPLVDKFLEEHYADRREEMFEELSFYQPIGRMGTPEEVASLAAFLCSSEAAFITGSAYDIDGGVTLLR